MNYIPAVSGMLEVLILIGIGVVGAGVIAVWFSGVSTDELRCTAWVDIHEITPGTHWGEATIQNTGSITINRYVVYGGNASLVFYDIAAEPSVRIKIDFTKNDMQQPIMVEATGRTGAAFCEVFTQ